MKEYLLLIDYGMEGYGIERFDSKEEMVEAIQNGGTFSNPFIMAKEMHLSTSDPDATEEKLAQAGKVGHELQGSGFDPGARKHELQGRKKDPATGGALSDESDRPAASEVCKSCGGSGEFSGGIKTLCKLCGGKGTTPVRLA